MEPKVAASWSTYVGLFMVTLATLMYEILLTRIFSVTMWYHFAFMAISIAMFGMTVGAMLVYLMPDRFAASRVKYHLAMSSVLFSILIVGSFAAHLNIRFVPQLPALNWARLYPFALTYCVAAIPFILSGVCVSLALTRFPLQVSKLYAADLAGAGAGCIALIYTLRVTDGPTAVIVAAALAAIGGMMFAFGTHGAWVKRVAVACSLLLVSATVGHAMLARQGRPLLRITWAKGKTQPPLLYEKWNSFSRITVEGDPKVWHAPMYWGISRTLPGDVQVRELLLRIDATAGTPLTAFDGNLNELRHLGYALPNMAHCIRSKAHVMVVGAGGGIDVLAALAFRQQSVTAVEMNGDIVDAVNCRFGDFTGHLDLNPRVGFVVDEARSYVTRQPDKFDIIQISFVDTWAATAAGAFVLAEQSLYTVEAWETFLSKLTPNGVLTCSRWYFQGSPYEIYRLIALARASLERSGITDIRRHIVVLRNMPTGPLALSAPLSATILVSPRPFSRRDLDIVERVAAARKFDVLLSPRETLDRTFVTITSTQNLAGFLRALPFNVTAPTDDSPFFFHMLRLRDVLRPTPSRAGYAAANAKAVIVLAWLLVLVVGLTAGCVLLPLALTTRVAGGVPSLPLAVFFGGIGFGFMLVEISQMQRLTVFLGHPTYALSVVLFSLLLSSSLGSYLTDKMGSREVAGPGRSRLLLLLAALIVFGVATPHLVSTFRGSITALRIVVATGILFSLGLFMGMPFALGMKAATSRSPLLTPWLWGINGATSVCASVVAVAIALSAGISASFWTGFACYAVAYLAFVRATHGPAQSAL